MKKICWLATGGTIASRPSENGLVPGFTAKEMLDMVPNLKDYAHIDCYDIMQLDSTNLQPEDWQYIAGYIEKLYEQVANTEIERAMEKTRLMLGFAPEEYEIVKMRVMGKCENSKIMKGKYG